MNRPVAFVAILMLLVPVTRIASAQDRENVIRVFRAYEALNADFVHSVSSGTGKSGKSYSVLRRETEQFAEGPYSKALAEAKEMICRSRDRQLLSSLLQVTGATSNSANEEPTSVLNEVASCQPDLLRELAATLTQRDRKGLANRSPQLRAFFK
jgi:hypothetical protein